MTSADPDGFGVAAIGSQVQSSRTSAPHYTLSRVNRHQREGMHISEAHTRTLRLGREGVGPKYDLPKTDSGPSISFTRAKQNDLLPPPQALGGLYSNDELGHTVDNQHVKFPRDATILVGTEPRGKLKDAALLHTHSAAFFGRESPGPASVGGKYGPQVGPIRPRMAPAGPFGQKLKTDWLTISDLPDNIAPNLYDRRDQSIGEQHLTHRLNQPVNAFGQQAKFPKVRNSDSVSTLDAARSCLGNQPLTRNRSEPMMNIGKGTRDGRAGMALCLTRDDMGPRAAMPKFTVTMPNLPSEREIMAAGFG